MILYLHCMFLYDTERNTYDTIILAKKGVGEIRLLFLMIASGSKYRTSGFPLSRVSMGKESREILPPFGAVTIGCRLSGSCFSAIKYNAPDTVLAAFLF